LKKHEEVKIPNKDRPQLGLNFCCFVIKTL
jgi:hypothetical protein